MSIVVGTSVFQFLFVTGFTAILHAVQSGSVDVLLALILLVGGVIGAQIGVGLAARLRAEQLRIGLALLERRPELAGPHVHGTQPLIILTAENLRCRTGILTGLTVWLKNQP